MISIEGVENRLSISVEISRAETFGVSELLGTSNPMWLSIIVTGSGSLWGNSRASFEELVGDVFSSVGDACKLVRGSNRLSSWPDAV